jgi:hypothetical protein
MAKKQSPIRIKPANRGKLHRALGVPQDEKIPPGKLASALASTSESLRKQAQFAKNAASWNH